MGVLKVKDPADPTGATWIDIMGTGVQGPPGGPVPVGGAVGEVIVKTGPADMEVGWAATHPRVALETMIASYVTGATVNVMADAITGDVTMDPDRYYHFFASHRCVEDYNGKLNVQMQLSVGTINLQGYDVVAAQDPDVVWGGWSQTWLHKGDIFTATVAPVSCRLRYQGSQPSLTVYSPRLYVLEY